MTPGRQPSNGTADPAVEAELDGLATMPIAQLRLRYSQLFRTEPPKAFGPDLLRRSIAHQIQEKAYGGLSRTAQQLLDQMVNAYTAKPGGKIALSRRIKPGSVLVREWQGRSYRVMVQAEGFAYDGKTFSNLSEIAGLITGTRWNGPKFFGLRSKSQGAIMPKTTDRSDGAKERSDPAAPAPSRLGGGSDYRKRNAERLRQIARGHRHGL